MMLHSPVKGTLVKSSVAFHSSVFIVMRYVVEFEADCAPRFSCCQWRQDGELCRWVFRKCFQNCKSHHMRSSVTVVSFAVHNEIQVSLSIWNLPLLYSTSAAVSLFSAHMCTYCLPFTLPTSTSTILFVYSAHFHKRDVV